MKKSFEDAPFLVISGLTQAGDLACVPCRACAISDRNAVELTTEEGFQLLERKNEMHTLIQLSGRRSEREAHAYSNWREARK